jgi:hypothetical protein
VGHEWDGDKLVQVYVDAMERRSEAGAQIERAKGQEWRLHLARLGYRMAHNAAMDILRQIEERRQEG